MIKNNYVKSLTLLQLEYKWTNTFSSAFFQLNITY